MVLTKEIGFTRQDIRGHDSDVVRREEPAGLWPWLQRKLWFLDDPGLRVVRETTNVEGMTEDEAIRYLVMHDEHEEIKEEEREKQQEDAERKAQSRQNMGAGNVPSGTGAGIGGGFR